MKHILIHIPVTPYGEYDIFNNHNNKAFVNSVKTINAGVCPNIGNRLWFQGIVSAIQNEENQLDYWTPTMSKVFINQTYDLIVAPMANIFAVNFIDLQERLADRFSGITIPVYVIACGVQAANYEELDSICSCLKESASKFISSVYDTGGEFALRGYFTKEFFDCLGFTSAVVTGCPSLYQLGRDIQISNEKVDELSFKPIINGSLNHYCQLMLTYPNAVFFDQEIFWMQLLDSAYFEEQLTDNQHLEKLIRSYGYETTKILLEDRIQLFPDMNAWRNYICTNHFSCSFGSRIHGSIMPILSGVPAILECRDARTREMAEFFNIPTVSPNQSRKSLYDLYLDTDYTNFNRNFSSHFDGFEDFLRKCGIVTNVNQNNPFFCNKVNSDTSENLEKRLELSKSLAKRDSFWRNYARLLSVKRKLFSLVRS